MSPPVAPYRPPTLGAISRGLLSLALAVLASLAALNGQARSARQPSLADETAKWRAEVETKLRAETGWLSVAGLFFLHPGENTIGSGAQNHVVLPRDAAPARAGTITLREGRVSFQTAGEVSATLNGEPATSGELRPAVPDRPADVLGIGRLALQVHRSGARLALRLRDPDGPVRATFTGMRWYPVDAAWRLTGEFVPHAAPRRVPLVNVLGDELEVASPGLVTFSVGGQTVSLTAFEEAGRLWFVFTDVTAGKGTYKAARFLYADAPRNGRVVLDFNRAENPPCAYNPFTTCPLPPKENRLPFAVPAGERDYPNRWQPR